ncbi:AAA-ATPase ASD, mitochondrial-like [Arachis stenosperma]|uniref:AAA-ATPase ASD, mitochondrial-like n=1 Tax=Arachis stenosperma TaxID=217475 RepID=UPI0025AD5DB3|nr:AAA-ATPase ASD, mitochondrial-like [Arachis stenosperma]
MGFEEMWSKIGSIMATIMFMYAMFEKFFPPHLRMNVQKYTHKLASFLSPYIQITFPEFAGERLKRSEAFTAIQTYLSATSSLSAKRLKAEVVKDSQTPVVLSMDDSEEVSDEFKGVKVWWLLNKTTLKTQSFSFYPASDEKRYYTLSFHNRYRDLIAHSYIPHVLEEGKAIKIKNRQLKLYTNNCSTGWYGWNRAKWSNVTFEHPARFDTLAMEPNKKEEIINDLIKFKKGKEYYAKIGKAWKRGYLLYGPPGTGKSTMIAAMANFLYYDVYDLELTSVKDNTQLRTLLIETSSKSILVIEDIDCSLDLTGKRRNKRNGKGNQDNDESNKDPVKNAEEENKDSKVTLSGLLNCIDGIWSACAGERIIVFTTNFVDKLDPALIRSGRMDKHIELSYCCFEAFKVLATNYLDIDDHHHHHLFSIVERLLGEVNVTPADVAEKIMPKSNSDDSEICLKNLIEFLESAKKKKEEEDEEESRLKEEKERENGELKNNNGVKENGFIH